MNSLDGFERELLIVSGIRFIIDLHNWAAILDALMCRLTALALLLTLSWDYLVCETVVFYEPI